MATKSVRWKWFGQTGYHLPRAKPKYTAKTTPFTVPGEESLKESLTDIAVAKGYMRHTLGERCLPLAMTCLIVTSLDASIGGIKAKHYLCYSKKLETCFEPG